tara:strand:- start:76 stop:276 length:201 start_codon:yes stop_codon:yes gene_type:complete
VRSFIALVFSCLNTVSFNSITLTASSLITVSIASYFLTPNLPLMKLAIKIRIGTWAKPTIAIFVSE